MSHQLCSVTVGLSVTVCEKPLTRSQQKCSQLLRANHAGLFLEEAGVCQGTDSYQLLPPLGKMNGSEQLS